MFCYIQKVKFKRDIGCSTSKAIEVYENKWTIENESKTHYDFRYSYDKFDRPIRTAYKISIQESYRENGCIKKKQFHICYMSYYDFVDFSFYDCHSKALPSCDEVLICMYFFSPFIHWIKHVLSDIEILYHNKIYVISYNYITA